jgi:hypothetical protein
MTATGPSPSDVDARVRLADALRVTIDTTVSADLDRASLDEAAAAVEALNRRLADLSGPETLARRPPDLREPAQDFFPTSPIMGLCNPMAPPVRVLIVPGAGEFPEIAGTANFGYPYQGPPTCVHGGIIAETFDEVLGAALLAAGLPGMTGTLTVRYRKPTPLLTDLRIEARVVGHEGRKVFAEAAIYRDHDVLTAEAEGVFIMVDPTQLLAMAEQNVDGVDPVMMDAVRAEALRRGAASDVHPGTPAD